jgi:hypothetical protein
MKKIIYLTAALILTVTLFTTTSCSKDKEDKPVSVEQQLLTAKTWQVEEVSETIDGNKKVTYKRGAQNNEDDFSMIRQSFKKNGSITYVDSFGASGTDGRYQLLSNQQMRLSIGGLSTVVFAVTVQENSFSYKQEIQGGVLQFTFSPVL